VTTPGGDWTTLVPVTGEAVALDLRLAQFPSRTLALTLDLAVQVAGLFFVIWIAGSVASSFDSAVATALSLVAVVSILVGLPTLVETLTRGRSLGKVAAGLRVVRDDGGPVRFRHSFVRALFMLVDFWLSGGFVGLVSALASQRSKRLGDHFAGTVVVRERVPSVVRADQLSYSMPPALEPWAASLDLARLPDVTALQARQLLARSGRLDPQVRAAMGTQLAAEVSTYVSPAPPPGLHPEAFLMAVLTERLRRATSEAPTPRRLAPTPLTGTAPYVEAPPGGLATTPATAPAAPITADGPFAAPA
jgi:uncharacterized RDD family membrane protein YckC